jgi:hypothetical protein
MTIDLMTIDLNMGSCSISLSEESKKLCIISLPWGLYPCNVLPQGIKPATNIFQQQMRYLYYDMQTIDTMALGYGIIDAHLDDITEVLQRLSNVGMQVNAEKCKWFHHSGPYLGFIIIRASNLN